MDQFESFERGPLLAIAIALCLKFFWSCPMTIAYLLFAFPVFAAVESRFLISLSRLPLSSPDFLHWRDICVHLIAPIPVLAIGSAVWLFQETTLALAPRFLACLLITLLCFLLGSLLKCYAIFFHYVNLNHAKRGCFGIVQRILLLTRSLLVFQVWLQYLLDLPLKWPLSVYLLWKAVFLGHSCIGLFSAWLRYTARKSKGFCRVSTEKVKDDCAICLCEPIDPCKLPCGHVFCRQCLERWLAMNPTCPTCRDESLPANVRMGEATTPWVFFVCPF
jgi:hypothetical protein